MRGKGERKRKKGGWEEKAREGGEKKGCTLPGSSAVVLDGCVYGKWSLGSPRREREGREILYDLTPLVEFGEFKNYPWGKLFFQ